MLRHKIHQPFVQSLVLSQNLTHSYCAGLHMEWRRPFCLFFFELSGTQLKDALMKVCKAVSRRYPENYKKW